MAQGFIKRSPTRKEKIRAEINRLEEELEGFGSSVSDSQIWHKKSRIESLKKQLQDLEMMPGKLNSATENIKDMNVVDGKAKSAEPELNEELLAQSLQLQGR